MIVYNKSKLEFSQDVLSNQIEEKIKKSYLDKLGRNSAKNEVNSWKNSMLYMNNILMDRDIPDDAQVSIEFQIPLTSKRIDFIITGLDDNEDEKVIIIELKQWSNASMTTKDGVVNTIYSSGYKDTAHPSYQAWSYASTISNFNQTVYDENIQLIPCAYLHNYSKDDVITNSFYQAYLDKAPVFLKNDAFKLQRFIKEHIKYGDSKNTMFRIEHGKIKPSKLLADSLVSMLKGNEEFVMIDDQKVVFETAKELALNANENQKQVLIVEGGPGTGKSVIAINLLVELTRKGMVTKYISKNAAPRAVYANKLTGTFTKSHIYSLFSGSGSFIDVEPNTFDALIVDEAHRLNLKSGLYQNQGENQVLEIINVAKMSIFFVDDNQMIHIKDIGDKGRIEKWAKQEGAQVSHLKLKAQFRCNGSDTYLAWLDNSLKIRDTVNVSLTSDEFNFKVFDSPSELFKEIENKNRINNKSRLVAGYCWNWVSSKNPNTYDIIFPEFDFHMKWNLKKDGSTWIIAEDSINQVGCIHTCQGLELDYVGVIIGNDFVVRDGKVVTNVLERSHMDKSIRGIKKMLKEDKLKALKIADTIIKNTYRTLMTRGMKGCYIYCTDQETRDYFKQCLSPAINTYTQEQELGRAAEDNNDYKS